MQVIEFIRGYDDVKSGLTALENMFGIRAKEYPEFDLILLNYDQIESPKTHPITRECRSLVIDYNLNVVSRSFDRFFNLGEGECEVDFSNAIAFEKADGSLISVYHVPALNQWHMRTRGTAFAEAQLPSTRSFQEAILETLEITFGEFQEKMSGIDPTLTFIFEFISPENRIVTRYNEPQLVLLGVREKTGKYPSYMNGRCLNNVIEVLTKDIGFKNIRAARSMPVTSENEVLAAVSELRDLEEGFVVLDEKNGTRVKIKSPGYLIAHRIRGEGLSPKRAAELVAIGEEEEFLAYFEEDREYFQPFIEARDELLNQVEEVFDSTKNIEDQKMFALAVKDYLFSALLFTARKKQVTILHAWSESKESYRSELILKVMECKKKQD